MAIQLGGLVSGFDTESLIAAMIQKDTKPLEIMSKKKTRLEDVQNAWKDVNMRLTNLRSMVNVLKNSDTFNSKLVTSSNDKILSVSAGSAAANGTHQLKINQLAEYNRYATASAAAISGDNEATASSTLAITGAFTIRSSNSTEDAVITVEISDSLQDISSKINAANVGVTASVVENRLLIRSNTMGEKGEIILTEMSATPVLSSLMLTETTAAQDARIEYEGLEFTRASNYISDLVTGVTLNLTGASDGGYVYFTISSDTARATEAIQNFVDQYNSLLNFIEEKTFVTPQSGSVLVRSSTYTALERGALQGDPTITSLYSQLRRMVSSSLSGFNPVLNSLSAIGIKTTTYGNNQKQVGYLTIDQAKLATALADPVSSATLSGRAQMPVQYNIFNGKTLAEITGDDKATAGRTALGLAGKFTIKTGSGSSFEIDVKKTDTLNVIRNKINAAAAGVTASVQNNQLVITSNTMGTPGRITMVSTGGGIEDNINELIEQIANLNVDLVALKADIDIEYANDPLSEYYASLMAKQAELFDKRDSLLDDIGAYNRNFDRTIPDPATGVVDDLILKGSVYGSGKQVIASGGKVPGSDVNDGEVLAYINDLLDDLATNNGTIAYEHGVDPTSVAYKNSITDRDKLLADLRAYISFVETPSSSNDGQVDITLLNKPILSGISAFHINPTDIDDYIISINPLVQLGLKEASVASDAGNALKGAQSGSFTMVINGKNYFIELNGPMTTQQILREINTVIGSAATASLDKNNRLTFTTLDQGFKATITIKDLWEGTPGDLSALGLVTGVTSRGKDLDAFFTASVPPGQATVVSKQPLGFNPVAGSGGKLVLSIDNREYTVEFVGSYNRGDIANHINKVIGEYGQAYLDENNFLVIRSLKSGDGSNVRINSFDNNLAGLNLTVGQSATAEKSMDGIAVVLDRFYETWVKSGGLLNQKDNSLTGQIRDIQKQMDNLTTRIDAKVERLWKQFSDMESKLQDLNSQSSTIDMYLANLLSSMSSNK